VGYRLLKGSMNHVLTNWVGAGEVQEELAPGEGREQMDRQMERNIMERIRMEGWPSMTKDDQVMRTMSQCQKSNYLFQIKSLWL
jgi:hypothetical protein